MAYAITRSILLFIVLFADINIFVYRTPCSCGYVCIGTSKSSVNTRVIEHKRSYRLGRTDPGSTDVRALRDMIIKVPEAVRIGDSVTLTCDYDLEQVDLYSIKWYRYDEEFYRFVPKESPPSRVFIMPHLNVDVSKSDQWNVTLTDVDRDTSGEFKCEVSADAPLFHTEIRSGHLLVAEIPDEGPVLRTDVQKVAPGAKIRANCTTPGSYPRMNVTWFINDAEISNHRFGIQIHELVIRYDALPGVEIVRSVLSVRATQDLFKGGKMRLKCLATLFALYSRAKEVELQEDAPQLALIMEPTSHTNSALGSEISDRLSNFLVLLIAFVHLQAWLRRPSDN